MPNTDNDDKAILTQIMSLVLQEAEKVRTNASFDGAINDGGAGQMEAEVKFFQYGLRCQLPPEWEKYKLHLNPEYQEYLRLKRKFG